MLSQSRDLSGQGYCPCKTSLSTSVTSISFHLLFFFFLFSSTGVFITIREHGIIFPKVKLKFKSNQKTWLKEGIFSNKRKIVFRGIFGR